MFRTFLENGLMNYRTQNKFAVASSTRTQLLGGTAYEPSTNGTAYPSMRPNKKQDGANGGQTISEQARMLLEEQNNREIAALSEKVSYMKNLAGDIEAAIQEDHSLLNQTGSTFDKVSIMMRGTLGNVNKMLATGGSKHMCYLIMFIVALFLGLYWLMK